MALRFTKMHWALANMPRSDTVLTDWRWAHFITSTIMSTHFSGNSLKWLWGNAHRLQNIWPFCSIIVIMSSQSLQMLLVLATFCNCTVYGDLSQRIIYLVIRKESSPQHFLCFKEGPGDEDVFTGCLLERKAKHGFSRKEMVFHARILAGPYTEKESVESGDMFPFWIFKRL